MARPDSPSEYHGGSLASVTLVWLVTGGVLLVGLALLGLTLRLAQSIPALVSPATFFALLTLHGLGMAGLSLILAAVVYGYVVRRWVPPSAYAMWIAFVMTMVGVGLLVVAALGGYGAGWSMLYPLPGRPGPALGWPGWAALSGILGFGAMVLAAAVWSLDFLRAGLRRYGGLGRMLGIDIIRGRVATHDPTTNASVIAGTVVALDVLAALPAGGLGFVILLAGVLSPTFTANALLTKNLTYFAGHVMVNVPIYLGAGLAYALLPEYTHRAWPATRLLVAGWLLTLSLVMLASFHHFYQDFAEPLSAQIVGQVASYATAIPPLVVTIFGGLLLVYRSGLHWSPTPMFLFAALAAWTIGGYAAALDATPWLNQYLHNTLWVPAYFHMLMALSVLLFTLGGVYHVVPELTGRRLGEQVARQGALALIVGGVVLTGTWFIAGLLGQPRRYPVYLTELTSLTWLGTASALVALGGAVAIGTSVIRTLVRRTETSARPD